jgi:hypothetical protein
MGLSRWLWVGSIALASIVVPACDSDGDHKSELRENIEGTIGEPQQGTGVLGGNAAPLVQPDAGVLRDGGAAAPGETDAGSITP